MICPTCGEDPCGQHARCIAQHIHDDPDWAADQRKRARPYRGPGGFREEILKRLGKEGQS